MTTSSHMATDPQSDARQVRLTMAENGRVLVPAHLRAALGLRAGGPVIVRLEGEKLIIEPLAATVRRVQDSMRRFADPSKSLVDELISDRRRAADRE